MSDLTFVPRDLVNRWQKCGWRPVPGYEAPHGWAVLMEHAPDREVVRVPTIPQPERRSNVSAGARSRNLVRYAGAA